MKRIKYFSILVTFILLLVGCSVDGDSEKGNGSGVTDSNNIEADNNENVNDEVGDDGDFEEVEDISALLFEDDIDSDSRERIEQLLTENVDALNNKDVDAYVDGLYLENDRDSVIEELELIFEEYTLHTEITDVEYVGVNLDERVYLVRVTSFVSDLAEEKVFPDKETVVDHYLIESDGKVLFHTSYLIDETILEDLEGEDD